MTTDDSRGLDGSIDRPYRTGPLPTVVPQTNPFTTGSRRRIAPLEADSRSTKLPNPRNWKT
ncbi:hypothetical protein C446_14649 [Halobiforma nitratireducens JCM 10879]|uniref:Uncharacterized protein n=1 Tax=Halobiforma nitratireducens JCM 10879 TaxID=1227454 RepID=M0LK24_9EURY|nr:hypothetical protein C446_14649 [Halobiforma nitratireducens JCM 10879]